MKSTSSPNNDYFSFTHNENGIEIIWEFNAQDMSWTVLVFKEDEKQITKIAASATPTAEKVNDYDLQRLFSITEKMSDFLAKKLKLEPKTPINK